MVGSGEKYAAVLASGLIASAILWLAVPRLAAHGTALSGQQAAVAFGKSALTDPEKLRQFANNRERALSNFADQSYSLQLIGTQYLLWRVVPNAEQGREIARMRHVAVRELSWRPMRARSWWGVVLAGTVGGQGRSELVRDALMMSVDVQPFATSLVPARLRQIVRHWTMFSPDQKARLKPQFIEAWRRDNQTVLAIARTPGHLAIIRGVLAERPELLAAFEGKLRDRRRK